MPSVQNRPKIAYLLKTFPRLSETFILNEILGLEALGLAVQIFSLKRPEGEPCHPAVAEVKAGVTYVPGIGPRSRFADACLVVLSHLSLLLMHPERYIKSARSYFRQPGKPRLKHFLQAGYLARALRRNAFDHLHAHFANVPTSVAEVVHHLSGIPYSFTAHAKDIYLTPPAELSRKMTGATCVLTCTAYNQRHLQTLPHGATPIRLAYHGVDVSRFSAAALPHTPSQSGVPLILSIGRFCGKKGFPYLIQACRNLKDQGRDFQCQIIGYGELQAELEELIDRLDLGGCVRLPGKMTQNEVIGVYRQASLFVLPCRVTDDGDRDGIPNVLIEAMVSGVPVISTNVSGISELVNHMQNGILVNQRDVDALTGAMEILLDRPDLGRRLAENGRAKVLREFTLKGSAGRVFDILMEACGTTRQEGLFSPSEAVKAEVR